MNYNWNWGVLFEEPYLHWLISGFGWTVSVALTAWCLALVPGAWWLCLVSGAWYLVSGA